MPIDLDDPVQQYLDHYWPDGLICPLCRHLDWFWPPDGSRVLEGTGHLGLDEQETESPGVPVGIYLLICSSCGFVAPVFDEAVLGAVTKANAEQTILPDES